jgi:outer membrane protein insertion porin family
MKAASSFMSAASAVALSAGLIVTGSVAVNLASSGVVQAAVVNNIDVRGNQRVDASTIRGNIGIRPGTNVTNQEVDDAVRRLFATGLFSDVRISQSGSTLIVQVEEYSIVNQVLFQGNRRVRDPQLREAVQLASRSAFSNAILEADVQAIRDAYSRVGRDDTVVTTEVVQLGDNRVNVIFNVQEGGRTRIEAINFIGNNTFSERRLRDVISTKRSNVLSFITRNDIYDENRLRADEEQLRRFYYNRGFADFRILSATTDFNESDNAYTINITVDEGARYRFGDVQIETTIDGIDEAQLLSLVETRSGEWYSAEDVEASIVALTERVADNGFAFAQVTPRGSRNLENQSISVVYSIDQGPRAYVERIEIRGNTRTRDYVIRREFDISEGDAFNQVMIRRARQRLERLQYFSAVNISTSQGSEPDQVVLIVDVTEQSTGELSIGGGYTTGSTPTSGFSVEGSVAERNFLGRGQSIRLSVGGGRNSRDYTLSFTEPYFLGQRISAGFDIFRQNREYDNYSSELTGGTIRFGLPITEALSTQLAYNYSQERYAFRGACVDGDGTPTFDPITNPCLSPFLGSAIENQSPWTKSSVTASLTYNTIDNMQDPRQGLFANFSTEVAGLGGDARFVKLTGRGTYYHTLVDEYNLVGLLSAGGGYVTNIGGGELRVFDNFQSTDRIIRGFRFNGIGPTDNRTGDHLGGTTYFNASAEVQFPIPVLPEGIGLKGALFADAATLYGNELSDPGGNIVGTDMAWRASVGAGVIWASPFGPIRVDYAMPVLKEDSDRVQNFNFGISTRF